MLAPDDPLPRMPDRIVVSGTAGTGTGTTTLAVRIAAVLDMPHVEIDGLHWRPDWTPRDAFSSDVDALVAGDRWVTEWQDRIARERLAATGELLVWIDSPITVTMRRVVARTIRRRLCRTELWHGNVELPLWTIATDRDHIVRWSWRTRARHRDLRPPRRRTPRPSGRGVRRGVISGRSCRGSTRRPSRRA